MWNKCPMAASHGTTESLRTAEYTESLEHFALGIPFFGIFSGFSGAQCLCLVIQDSVLGYLAARAVVASYSWEDEDGTGRLEEGAILVGVGDRGGCGVLG